MADQKDLFLLFERYLSGSCSDEETKLLFNLFGDPANEDSLRKLIKQALDSGETTPSAQARIDEITLRAEENIIEAIRSESPEVKIIPFKIKNILIVAAAISLICTIGIGLYTVNQQDSIETNELVTEFGSDVLPGGNRATLSLGNGEVITLSDKKTGIIIGDSLKYEDGSSLTSNQVAAKNYVLSTPKGGQYSAVLSDGTRVWLNAESSLTYPVQFTGNERRVELVGEAYFEVSHNRKPFIVSSRQQEIEVLGTHFNVNAYKNQAFTTTTLISGSVEIVNLESQVTSRLSPGKQSTVRDGRINIQEVNVTPFVSWRNGLFSFRETEMHEVMNQLSRWYDVEVIYERPVPPTHFFGDIRRNESLASVLSILKQSGVNFKIEKDGSQSKLIVLP